MAIVAFMLTSCGGTTEFPPVVTGVKVQSLSYGRIATIYLGGKDLRSSLVVESDGCCTRPSFASYKSTDVLALKCLDTVVGDLPLTIKSATDDKVFTTTFTVPKPQVSVMTNKRLSNVRAIVAMAHTNVFNSANSEFYVNLVDNTFLNYKNAANPSYALFRKVVQGIYLLSMKRFKAGSIL